jgi:hypothetical protein
MAVGHDALGCVVFAIVFKNPKAGDEPPKTGRRPDVTISNQVNILPQSRGISSSAFSARGVRVSNWGRPVTGGFERRLSGSTHR